MSSKPCRVESFESEPPNSSCSDHLLFESFSRDYRPEGRLHGMVALINAADPGIAKDVSFSLSQEGASVVLVFGEKDLPANTSNESYCNVGVKVLNMSADLGVTLCCRAAVERTIAEFGKLDILINIAAGSEAKSSLSTISEERLRLTFDENVFSALFLAQAASKYMEGGGAIVNISSFDSDSQDLGFLDYTMTHEALSALTRTLSANLLDQSVRVNGLMVRRNVSQGSEGVIPASGIVSRGNSDGFDRGATSSCGSSGYVFLASNASSPLTGKTFLLR